MNIDYKLARQLKDAGYPQKKPYVYDEITKKVCPYFPTLSELIEACGDGLIKINRTNTGWKVYTFDKNHERYDNFQGNNFIFDKELIIAVVRLWLILNKK